MDQEAGDRAASPLSGSAGITRRQSMKVGAGIVALAQCLGLPAALLAGAPGGSVQLKYYRTTERGSRLVYAEPLASPVLEMLMDGGVAELELKWYYGSDVQVATGLLGSARLPAEVQSKLGRVRELQQKQGRG